MPPSPRGRAGPGSRLLGEGRLAASWRVQDPSPRGTAARSALAHKPAAGESAVVSSLAGEPSRGEAKLVTSLSNFPTSPAPKIAKRRSRGLAWQRPAWGEGPGRGTAARVGGCAVPVAVTVEAEGDFGQPESPVPPAVPCVWMQGAAPGVGTGAEQADGWGELRARLGAPLPRSGACGVLKALGEGTRAADLRSGPKLPQMRSLRRHFSERAR